MQLEVVGFRMQLEVVGFRNTIILSHDIPFRIVAIFPGNGSILGYDTSELIGKSIRCLEGPQTENIPFEHAIQSVAANQSSKLHVILYNKQKSSQGFSMTCSPLLEKGGEVASCQLELETSNALTLEQTYDDNLGARALLLLEKPYTLQMLDIEFTKMFGYTSPQLLGKSICQLFTSIRDVLRFDYLLQTVRQGVISEDEIALASRGGETILSKMKLVPVCRNGSIDSVLVLFFIPEPMLCSVQESEGLCEAEPASLNDFETVIEQDSCQLPWAYDDLPPAEASNAAESQISQEGREYLQCLHTDDSRRMRGETGLRMIPASAVAPLIPQQVVAASRLDNSISTNSDPLKTETSTATADSSSSALTCEPGAEKQQQRPLPPICSAFPFETRFFSDPEADLELEALCSVSMRLLLPDAEAIPEGFCSVSMRLSLPEPEATPEAMLEPSTAPLPEAAPETEPTVSPEPASRKRAMSHADQGTAAKTACTKTSGTEDDIKPRRSYHDLPLGPHTVNNTPPAQPPSFWSHVADDSSREGTPQPPPSSPVPSSGRRRRSRRGAAAAAPAVPSASAADADAASSLPAPRFWPIGGGFPHHQPLPLPTMAAGAGGFFFSPPCGGGGPADFSWMHGHGGGGSPLVPAHHPHYALVPPAGPEQRMIHSGRTSAGVNDSPRSVPDRHRDSPPAQQPGESLRSRPTGAPPSETWQPGVHEALSAAAAATVAAARGQDDDSAAAGGASGAADAGGGAAAGGGGAAAAGGGAAVKAKGVDVAYARRLYRKYTRARGRGVVKKALAPPGNPPPLQSPAAAAAGGGPWLPAVGAATAAALGGRHGGAAWCLPPAGMAVGGYGGGGSFYGASFYGGAGGGSYYPGGVCEPASGGWWSPCQPAARHLHVRM